MPSENRSAPSEEAASPLSERDDAPPPEQEAPPKLADNWMLVLLRGLIEGLFIVLYFVPGLESVPALTVFAAGVVAGGSVIELIMAMRLPGHAFRGILLFSGVVGLCIAAFLFYAYPGTTDLFVVVGGLWVALRGFAALWLGLSIVEGTFDRAVPMVAGVVGLLAGAWAMIFLTVEVPALVNLVAFYGAVSLVVHLLVALRMRSEEQRLLASQEG